MSSINDISINDKVIWRHSPPGGYGYIFPIRGVVVGKSEKRIKIEVQLRSGPLTTVWVRPESLDKAND